MEYALKASDFASENEGRVAAQWDRFAIEVDAAFSEIDDEEFAEAVGYLLQNPPRKQVRRDGALTFEGQVTDTKRKTAQQALLMVRTVRNNLFHGSKQSPGGETEEGRNHALVRYSLVVLRHCTQLNTGVRRRYEL